MILLAAYNKDPWDVDKANMTLANLFELWLEHKAARTGDATVSYMKTTFSTYCKAFHQFKYANIKAYHMQETIDNCGHGYSTQNVIKGFWRHLDKLALELDITTRNYAGLLKSATPAAETSRVPFTNEEVAAMWAMQGEPWVDSVLFLLYTGFRFSEMLDLRTAKVNLADSTMMGGTKTQAGKDRIVPIHSKIRHIVERRMEDGNKHLFSYNDKGCGGTTYRTFWREIMETASMQHTPHECRHTFRSRLDSAGANKRCIDLMMGHQSGDIGERIYTHKTFDELKNAIELLG
jgi:integrase